MRIIETIHAYEGLWTPGASCGLQIFLNRNDVPTVVLSELPSNKNTSVTNLIECIAAEVLQKHLPQRLGENPPFFCVEHYPREPESALQETFDLVTFQMNAPERRWKGGKQRLSLGKPEWRRIERRDLERMIGCSYLNALGILERANQRNNDAEAATVRAQ